MTFATADTREPKRTLPKRVQRLPRPGQDFSRLEELRLDRPPVLGDPRGESV
jgi:hypothetical protein